MKLEQRRYRVTGMHCASCVARVEKGLRKVGGVEAASVNLAMEEAQIEIDPERFDPRAVESVEGFTLRPATDEAPPEPDFGRQKAEVVAAVVLSAIVMAASMNGMPRIAGVAAAISVVVLGRSFLVGALKRARHFAADMDTLVALGTWTALLWSWLRLLRGDGGPYWFDGAAMITAFILFGRWLESRARHKTGAAVRSLMDLAPQRARVERGDDVVEIPAAGVAAGTSREISSGSPASEWPPGSAAAVPSFACRCRTGSGSG